MFKFYSSSGRTRPVFFWRAGIAGLALCLGTNISAQPVKTPSQSEIESRLAHAGLPRIPLKVGNHRIIVEVAADDSTRGRGLMFRESLPPNHGMLFVFPEAGQQCFWMKNTPLPLSIAFIDATGSIVNLADMQPQSLDTHCAIGPVLYALEMEQGWFAGNNIRAGAQIQGLPRVAPRNQTPLYRPQGRAP